MTAELIHINLTGVDPKVVHIHITNIVDNTEVLARLESMENTMSDLSNASAELASAVLDVVSRVDEDVAHLQDLLDQALATDASDQATIDQLRADAAQTVQSLTDSTNRLKSINPDPSFPVVDPGTDPGTPVDPGTDPNA